MHTRGFTFIELVIVIGLISAIAGFSVPMSIGFYNTQITKSTSDEIFSTLKKAQAYAQYRRADMEFGVAFDTETDTYTLFRGEAADYTTPMNTDEVYNLRGINVTFDPELVIADGAISFEKGTGMPTESTVITLTKGNITQEISVCASGLIELGNDCDTP